MEPAWNRKRTRHSHVTATGEEFSPSQRGLRVKSPSWKHSSQTLFMAGVELGEPAGHREPLAQTKAAAELHPEREP